MTLRQISLSNFRNIEKATLQFCPSFNIICGRNASGKTSILEAVSLASQGRSFKTNNLNLCIQHEKESFLLFSLFSDFKSGISRDTKQTKIRVDDQTITKLSSLATKSPIRVINSSSFDLVSGKPSYKRDYINWYLFHVEQSYKKLWSSYSHILKQRNSILKSKVNINQLDYWDTYLSEYGEKIGILRQQNILSIIKIIEDNLHELVADFSLDIEYVKGWNEGKGLQECLLDKREVDLKYGFTSSGIHRDDFSIKTNSLLVQNELSRGQLKRLSIALIIAQISLLQSKLDKKVILLIDDLYAELDQEAVNLVMKILSDLDIQIFITTIDSEPWKGSKTKECKMFHVEHGTIKAEINH